MNKTLSLLWNIAGCLVAIGSVIVAISLPHNEFFWVTVGCIMVSISILLVIFVLICDDPKEDKQ